MVLSSWQSHCESSPGLSDDCRAAPSGLQTKPPDLGCESTYRLQAQHPPSPFIITQSKADTRFSVLRRVEGLVDLGTQHAALYNIISDYIAHWYEKFLHGCDVAESSTICEYDALPVSHRVRVTRNIIMYYCQKIKDKCICYSFLLINMHGMHDPLTSQSHRP